MEILISLDILLSFLSINGKVDNFFELADFTLTHLKDTKPDFNLQKYVKKGTNLGLYLAENDEKLFAVIANRSRNRSAGRRTEMPNVLLNAIDYVVYIESPMSHDCVSSVSAVAVRRVSSSGE